MATYVKVEDGVVVDRAEFDGSIPESWPERETWHESATAQIGWSHDGQQFTAPTPPPAAVNTSFLARDVLALLTAADLTAIKVAVDSDIALYGLWCSLLAQGEAPISIASPRFQAGWAAIEAALGSTRADELATALNIA
jgi:hypothetical protein